MVPNFPVHYHAAITLDVANTDLSESMNTNNSGSSLQENKCATWHYHDCNGQCLCYPQNVRHMHAR